MSSFDFPGQRSPYTLTVLPDRQAVVSPAHAPYEVLAIAITECLMEAEGCVRREAIYECGRAFIRYDRIEDDGVEFTAGVPVEEDSASFPVIPIAGGPAATVRYTGDHDGVINGFGRLREWICGQGLTPVGVPLQIFRSAPEPSFDAGAWDLELVWRVAGVEGAL
jgi:hypothetical protein